MQQTRSKASFNLPQRDHHRMFMAKGVSPKGLGEIGEMENEEVSIKMMQSLERFMRSYPSVWSELSVQHLLVEVADTRYASLPNGEAEERLRTIINRILVPIANIVEEEQGFIVVERQKIRDATLVLHTVQEECHLALADLKQEHDLSRRDLKELAKALEENRMAAEETGRKLASKEKQIQEIQQKQRNLVIRLVCGGRPEFLRWAREEIQSRNLVDLSKDLEHTWGVPYQVEGHMFNSDQYLNNSPANESPETSLRNWIDHKPSDKSFLHNWMSATVKLLCVVGLEVLEQAGESFDRVKGPLSIPFVIAGFWIGIARRMTLLAVATLFP